LKRLLAYDAVLYDANIIVLFCFYCPLRRNDQSECIVELDLTDKVRKISGELQKKGKSIRTIRVIMDELSEELLARVVKQRISEDEVRHSIGLKRGEPFPATLELQMIEKCRKTARKIQASWLNVVDFNATSQGLSMLRQFYRNVAQDPVIHARFPRLKGVMPSEADLNLMAFSADRGMPVLTDDAHFIVPMTDLRAQGLVTEVVPLRTIA